MPHSRDSFVQSLNVLTCFMFVFFIPDLQLLGKGIPPYHKLVDSTVLSTYEHGHIRKGMRQRENLTEDKQNRHKIMGAFVSYSMKLVGEDQEGLLFSFFS